MGKPLSLPADLVKDWAQRHAKANARLEGIELSEDYVCSEKVQQFLAMRGQGRIGSFRDTSYDMYVEPPPPDPSLGLRAVRNANGQIETWVDD